MIPEGVYLGYILYASRMDVKEMIVGKELLNEIVRVVREVYIYDVPEVIALTIVGGNLDYLEWMVKR